MAKSETKTEPKANKDGFIPGAPVDPEAYAKNIAERRLKDPYDGKELAPARPRYKAPSNPEEVLKVAKARGNYE